MSLYKQNDSEIWHVTISVNGSRVRRSTGTTDKKLAQRFHDELKASLHVRKSSGFTWHDACIEWLSQSERGISDRYTIRNLSIPNVPLQDLTLRTIIAALSEVKSKKKYDKKAKEAKENKPATFNRKANLVSAILNNAKRNGHIDEVPAIPKKQVEKGRIRWLKHKEWERLYAELPPHLKPMAAFAIYTGLRQSNVTQLEWNQIDLSRKVMWVYADQAKSGKPIGIPLSDDALSVLRSQKGIDAQYVFTYKGKPIAKIKTAWTKALKRAGIVDFRWHDLRHTWATWHVQAGTPLEVLQKLGGWASYSMVLNYAHFAPEYLAGFANNAKAPDL